MKICRVCNRTSRDVDEWHTVVSSKIVSEDGDIEETARVEACSWACVRFAFLASPDEREGDTPEAWEGEGTDF